MIQRNSKPSSQQPDKQGLLLQRSNRTTGTNSSQDSAGQPQHAPCVQTGGVYHGRNGCVNVLGRSTSICIIRSFTNPSFVYVITLCVFMILVFSNTTHMNKDEDQTSFRGGGSRSDDSSSSQLLSLFESAKHDSFGLLDDITNESWERMKHRVNIERMNHKEPNNPTHGSHIPKMWYQENFEPDFSCPHERRIGGMGDGGKWVCNPHRLVDMGRTRQTPGGCLIYSIGSDGNLMFEAGMADFLLLLQENNATTVANDDVFCEIHIFDPSPNYSNMIPEKYKHFMFYHPWGLKASSSDQDTKKDGSANTITGLPAPAAITRQEQSYQTQQQQQFITLQETVEKLEHVNRTIDIFKIDCENCEWTTYQDWLSPDLDIRQMLVEVHNVPIPQAINFFTDLQKAGYVTFHKEPNTQYADGNCQEYCFLKLDKPFFNS